MPTHAREDSCVQTRLPALELPLPTIVRMGEPGPQEELHCIIEQDAETLAASIQSRMLAYVGLGFAILFGVFCVISIIVIAFVKTNPYNVLLPPDWALEPTHNGMIGTVALLPNFGNYTYVSELVRFALTHLNTLATEAIVYVHSMRHSRRPRNIVLDLQLVARSQ